MSIINVFLSGRSLFGANIFTKTGEGVYFIKTGTPKISWLRKVDGNFVVTKQDPHIMLSDLNNIHPQVNFTFEPMVNNLMPFLGCLVIRVEAPQGESTMA